MARRLSSPVFVGRSDEFAVLLAAARAAQASPPSIVLVGGEAGVGKSRLVAEAAARLRDDGWLVLEGGSGAPRAGAPPLAPLRARRPPLRPPRGSPPRPPPGRRPRDDRDRRRSDAAGPRPPRPRARTRRIG